MKLATTVVVMACAALALAQGEKIAFMNPAPITIPDTGPANPYPSPITVSGVSGSILNVELTLFQLSHTFPADLDMLLVGPGGQSVIFMSDAGGGNDIVNVNLTFSDFATQSLPETGQIVSGVYLPTNYGSGDTFPPPAPPPPYGAAFNVFGGTNPNGVWNLYIVDDAAGDSGSVAGGWQLTICIPEPATLGLLALLAVLRRR